MKLAGEMVSSAATGAGAHGDRQDQRASARPVFIEVGATTPSFLRETDIVETAPSCSRSVRRAVLGRRNERAIEAHAVTRVHRMPLWQSSLAALVGLAFVLGIALGEMVLGGAVVHALIPARHFDIYHALHDQLVTGCLIGVSLLWLLPPHPWAKRLVEATDRAGPAEQEPERRELRALGGPHRALSPRGSGPARRPEESQGGRRMG